MIPKLKNILETINEVNTLLEFPMKGGPLNVELFTDHEQNFAYVLAVKKHGKLIDKYKKHDVWQFTPTNNKKNINDVFVYGNFAEAYFQYEIVNGFIQAQKVWQGVLNIGFAREIVFNYYLNKFKGIISDVSHTIEGEKYWKKMLKQAKEIGYKTYVLKNGKEIIPLDDLKNIDNYTHSPSYKFVIEK